MTLPKGWKKEQTTTKRENSSDEQKEQISSKNDQTSSTITVDDKIIIQELIAKHNVALDNKNTDEWTSTCLLYTSPSPRD